MLCVSQDHSPGAGTVHLVFLEINESLDWSSILLKLLFDILNTFVRFALILLLIIDKYFYEKK